MMSFCDDWKVLFLFQELIFIKQIVTCESHYFLWLIFQQERVFFGEQLTFLCHFIKL